MWNQLALKSRPIFTNHRLLMKRYLHYQSAIKKRDSQQLIKILTNERVISLLPKNLYSSTADSSVTSKSHQEMTKDNKGKDDDDNKVTIDEQILDKLYEQMDRQIEQIDQFMESNGKNSQVKIYGLTLITVVAGVFAGAYAAHLGAWFLDKIGLFMFQEEDDD
ncbi:uncharacterized protein LOC128391270 [Panonychus citri]|uniref:uncharacterized protein LOC128391270 n=1 Tax=Panonychus citri TaxID=50023 RepID=UPI002307068C|nr:uncharacterized protein LOC128391270 [Panonychus citri]